MTIHSFGTSAQRSALLMPLYHLFQDYDRVVNYELNKVRIATPKDDWTEEFVNTERERLEKEFQHFDGK